MLTGCAAASVWYAGYAVLVQPGRMLNAHCRRSQSPWPAVRCFRPRHAGNAGLAAACCMRHAVYLTAPVCCSCSIADAPAARAPAELVHHALIVFPSQGDSATMLAFLCAAIGWLVWCPLPSPPLCPLQLLPLLAAPHTASIAALPRSENDAAQQRRGHGSQHKRKSNSG